MKKQTIYLGLAVTMIVALLLGACAPATDPGSVGDADPIVLTDALGREVRFAAPPERIVIGGRANFMLNDAVYLFPMAQERVVGLTRATQEAGFVGVIEPEAEEKLRFEADSGAEELAAVNPDVVILKSLMAEQLGPALEALEIPVVYLDLETPEQYYRDLAILGELFAAPERAEEVIAFYRDRLDAIEAEVGGLATAERPRVLLLQYDARGDTLAFKTPPATWIQTWMVEFAGGQPVWTDASGGGWSVVNMEQIAAWNPDHILMVSYFEDVDAVVARLEDDPLWQSLEAVQQGRLYAFPKDYYSWDQPDTRWILGVSWVARTLHPERFAELDVMALFYEFYGELYGLDRATVEAEILPRLEGDLR